jgi:glycosyltransferase involved in cell wall biosynthesis
VELSRFVDAPPIDLTKLELPPGQKAIVCVGRLDPQKGFDGLLKVTPRILAALPEHDLLFVGDGPQRAALVTLAEQLGIAPRMHFAGWRGDVPQILAAAEMLVLPSRWEGMPNVVLEAMAAGKPVVATSAEGVTELLGDGADEQTVALGGYEALAGRIIQLAQNPQLSAELGRCNRERASSEFSLGAMVERYERLYSEVLAS